MSESSAPTPNAAPDPTFVLVRSQMGENIGGAARAMWNFELDRMRLVAPRDGWPNPRAVALASGAGRLLDQAGVFESTAEAVADCDYVYATTARVRGLTKPVLEPADAMDEARALKVAGKKVAVLFGPERAGLENEDVARANAIITVPVNPEFYSLNLAQCVLLVAYEWRRARGSGDGALAQIELASRIEVEKLSDHYEQRLDEAGYLQRQYPRLSASKVVVVLEKYREPPSDRSSFMRRKAVDAALKKLRR